MPFDPSLPHATTATSADSAVGEVAAHPPGARRGRPGYDRDSLIDVCVQVFNRHGYGRTSMGTLAAELGISKSAIYHHVDSKEEILEAALLSALDAYEFMLNGLEASPEPGIAKLEAAIRGTVHVLIKHMPNVTLLLRLRGNSPVETAALQRRRAITRYFAQLVEQAQAEGDLRPDISTTAAPRLLLGMINSIVSWYHPTGPESEAELADTVIRMTLDGMRCQN